jgi:hypothetical protein
MLANPEWLPLIHFSDESRFVLGDDKRWVWYGRGEENESATHATQKFAPSVMIFAVIGDGDKSKLLFVERTIDADREIENLNELGFIEELDRSKGFLRWIFQQDGAPCHTSQKALDWIEENCDLLSGWPANSPDLNPIELLWAILKHSVAAYEPKSIDELKQVLLQAWDTIQQSTIDHLCMNFADRCQLCINVDGQSISKLLWQCGKDSVYKELRAGLQNHSPWTASEDQQVYEGFRTLGTHWQLIARLVPNRSATAVKNRWYTVLQKRERRLLPNTEMMLTVRENMRNHEGIPQLYLGDPIASDSG